MLESAHTLKLPAPVASRKNEIQQFFNPEVLNYYFLTVHANELRHIEGKLAKGENPLDNLEILQKEAKLEKSNDALSDREYDVCKSQYRALKHLFAEGDVEVNPDINPVTDLLALISPNMRAENWDSYSAYDGSNIFQLCVPGLPTQAGVFEKLSAKLRQDQYSRHDTSKGELKTYRTLVGYGKWQTTLIRSLHLMSYVAREDPNVLREAFVDYVDRFTGDQGTTHGMALGILEILHTTHLLTDDRFEAFAGELRDIVLEGAGSYEHLARDYHYSVVDNSYFWMQKYRPDKPSPQDEMQDRGKELHDLRFPDTARWKHLTREYRSIKRQIVGATDIAAIASAVPANEEKLLDAVVAQRKTKDMLSQRLTLREHDMKSFLAGDIEPLLRKIAGDTPLDTSDHRYLQRAMHIVFEHFQDDQLVSRKLKTALHHPNSYQMNTETYSHVPLVRWLVLFRNDPRAVEMFRAWAKEKPDSLYLAFKGTLAKAAKLSFASSEKEFLYDPNFEVKATSESMLTLINNLASFSRNQKIDLQTVFNAGRRIMAEETKRFLQPAALKRRRAELARMVNRIHWRRWGLLPRGTTITKSDVIAAVEYPALVAGLVTGFSLGSFELYKLTNPPGRFDRKLVPDSGSFYTGDKTKIPSKLTSQERKKQKYVPYFDVLHAPKAGPAADPNYRYFFPSSIEDEVGVFEDFQNGQQVRWIYDAGKNADDSNLVFKVDYPSGDIYTPYGWKAVKLWQEKGLWPKENQDFGYLRYDRDKYMENPYRVAIDVQPQNLNGNGERIELRKDTGRIFYIPQINAESMQKAWNMNEKLTGDADLQKLHADFLSEMDDWNIKYNSTEDYERYTSEEREATASAIIVKYMVQYGDYTDTKRFYDLALDDVGEDPNDEFGAALIAIANNPDKGYECVTASHAFQDFFKSAGVRVSFENGMELVLRYDMLWGKYGHKRNIVRLPNGQILKAEMQPVFSLSRTPKETLEEVLGVDIDINTPKSEFDNLIQKFKDQFGIKDQASKGGKQVLSNPDVNVEYPFEDRNLGKFGEYLKTITEIGLGVGAAGMLYFGSAKLRKDIPLSLISRRVEEAAKQIRNLSPVEQRVAAAMSYRFARLPFDDHFVTKANYLFELVSDLNPQKEGPIIDWLLSSPEGSDVLSMKDAKQAFVKLQPIFARNIGNFADILPERVRKVYEALAKESSPHNNVFVSSDDVPIEFTMAYECGRIIKEEEKKFSGERMGYTLKRDSPAFQDTNFLTDEAILAKANELKAIIQLRYARGEVSSHKKPIFNMFLTLLADTNRFNISTQAYKFPTIEKAKESGMAQDPAQMARIQSALRVGNVQSSYAFPTKPRKVNPEARDVVQIVDSL